MVAPTSFSVVANNLRQTLGADIDDLDESSISISNPKNAKPLTSQNSLNLFFYRVEDNVFPVDGVSSNPMLVGLSCLITAYGIDETDAESTTSGNNSGVEKKITSGENDLRLIGEVMRVLHESPVLVITENNQSMHLQSIRMPLSLDDINHIWSTQGDTAYRLSVAYQFSLIPVPFKKPQRSSPLVTNVGANIYSDMQPPVLPATGFAVHFTRPGVDKKVIDISNDNWSPNICFVNNNELTYVLEMSDTAINLQTSVLVSGSSGTVLEFYWEVWEWDLLTNKGGWKPPQGDTLSAVVTIPEDDDLSEKLFSNVIDPQKIDERLKFSVEVPFDLPPADNIRLQASLYVVRKQTRYRPQESPYFVNIRSNLLAVTIVYQGTQ